MHPPPIVRQAALPHRADVRAAIIRDLATFASVNGPLNPADSAAIAHLYRSRLDGTHAQYEVGHRVRTGLMVA